MLTHVASHRQRAGALDVPGSMPCTMREASRVGERDLSGGAARANDFATRVGSYTDRNNYSALRLDSPNLR